MLRAVIEKEVGIKCRTNKLGTAQRTAMHFAALTDVNEAYLCGKAAVEAALAGTTARWSRWSARQAEEYRCTTGLADLKEVANGEKKVPREFINEAGNGVTEQDARLCPAAGPGPGARDDRPRRTAGLHAFQAQTPEKKLAIHD